MKRRQAHQATQLLTIMALQFTTPRKIIYRQFDLLLSSIAQFYKDLPETKELADVDEKEIVLMGHLYAKFKSATIDQNDKMQVSGEEKHLPEEVQTAMKKVDYLDVFEFHDGVDPDSPSFKFKNSMQAFRIENRVEVQILDTLTKHGDHTKSEA